MIGKQFKPANINPSSNLFYSSVTLYKINTTTTDRKTKIYSALNINNKQRLSPLFLVLTYFYI